MSKNPILMTPGPINVPKRVYEAEAVPMIHHRSPEFSDILKGVISNLKPLIGTSNNDIFITSSSGRGAMEASIVNIFSQGDEILAVTNGQFGGMFADIACSYGLNVHRIFQDWGEEIEKDKLNSEIKKYPKAKGIIFSHSDTSVAIENPLDIISSVSKEHGLAVVVDAVSTLGGTPIEMDKYDLDIVAGASQKCLMAPAGLGVIAVSKKALEMSEKSNLPRYYWDFGRMKKYMDKPASQTPNSTPVSLVRALGESLKMIHEEGVSNVFKRHKVLADGIRAAITSMGLDLYPKIATRRPTTVSAIYLPPNCDSKKFRQDIRERYNIFLAGGLGMLEKDIFRIGHMGNFFEEDANLIINVLEEWFNDNGFIKSNGLGINTLKDSLSKNNLNDLEK